MAVVPSLAAMAALTLFQNPHTQPEGYSVDYSAYSAPATKISAVIKAWLVRMSLFAGLGEARYKHPTSGELRMRTHLQNTWRPPSYGNGFSYRASAHYRNNAPWLVKRRDNMLANLKVWRLRWVPTAEEERWLASLK